MAKFIVVPKTLGLVQVLGVDQPINIGISFAEFLTDALNAFPGTAVSVGAINMAEKLLVMLAAAKPEEELRLEDPEYDMLNKSVGYALANGKVFKIPPFGIRAIKPYIVRIASEAIDASSLPAAKQANELQKQLDEARKG